MHTPQSHRMPVSESDGGAPGYGSIQGAGGAPHTEEDVESAPLLSPQDPPAGNQRVSSSPSAWLPLTKEELLGEAGGGGRWKKIRSRLVWLFWLCWLAMLGTAIAIVVQSPRPTAAPLRWWQKSLFYQLQPALFTDAPQPGSPGGVEGEFTILSPGAADWGGQWV